VKIGNSCIGCIIGHLFIIGHHIISSTTFKQQVAAMQFSNDALLRRDKKQKSWLSISAQYNITHGTMHDL